MRFLIVIALAFSLFDLACTNRAKYNVKQPAPAKQKQSQMQAMQQKPQMTSQNKPDTNTKQAAAPKYKYPNDKGIGPIKTVKLGAINQKLVDQGEKIFNTKCIACHRLKTRLVGPPLHNITKKNTPEYIMNYLLNTTEMQQKDPLLKKLVAEYKVIMPDQNLDKEQARALLEFFRSKDTK